MFFSNGRFCFLLYIQCDSSLDTKSYTLNTNAFAIEHPLLADPLESNPAKPLFTRAEMRYEGTCTFFPVFYIVIINSKICIHVPKKLTMTTLFPLRVISRWYLQGSQLCRKLCKTAKQLILFWGLITFRCLSSMKLIYHGSLTSSYFVSLHSKLSGSFRCNVLRRLNFCNEGNE